MISSRLYTEYGAAASITLVQFRAGRMMMEDKMVHADKRKGLLYMHKDHGSLRFCWRDRITGSVDLDIPVSQKEFEYRRVHECTTGRVYVLKYLSCKARIFFWMQEPRTDRDAEYSARINELLGANIVELPQSPSVSRQIAGVPQTENKQQSLEQDNKQQMEQLESTNGCTNDAHMICAEQQAAIAAVTKLSNTSNNSVIPYNMYKFAYNFYLYGKDAIGALLDKPSFVEPLCKQLPVQLPNCSTSDSVEQIQKNLRSPQFYEAFLQFATDFDCGRMGPLAEQFGMNEAAVAAANAGDFEKFLRALDEDQDNSDATD